MKKNIFRITALLVALAILATAVAGMFGSQIVSAQAMTSARSMCTIEMSTGRILYAQNADAKIPMASTTKIVTAIAAIEGAEEKGIDIDTKIKVNDKAVGIEGTSIYLQKGEELTIRELLYGLMLRSGNDCGVALAYMIDGDNAKFCERMQQVSQKAGATNSNYKNAHGLDEDGHYTTARDLAKITAYAMKNPVFAEIAKTKEYKIDGVEYPRVLQNKNRLLRSLDGCVGVKTGFTKKAGRCYVGAREFDGMTVICVVLNCGPMFEECEAIMKRAANEFKMTPILTEDQFINDMQAIATENFAYPIKSTDNLDISIEEDRVFVKLNNDLIHQSEVLAIQ